MPSEFSFSSLIKPGDGARHAIEREINVRVARESVNMEPEWIYSGPSSYLKQHGQYFPGVVLPDEYDHLFGPPMKCHVNTLTACADEPTLRYFTGVYTAGRTVCDHSWCVDPAGNVVEVTYPSKGVEGARMTRHEDMGVSDFEWMPPQHWYYFGLEFKPEFIGALVEEYGLYLPVLTDGNPYTEDMLSTPYSVDGWPIP